MGGRRHLGGGISFQPTNHPSKNPPAFPCGGEGKSSRPPPFPPLFLPSPKEAPELRRETKQNVSLPRERGGRGRRRREKRGRNFVAWGKGEGEKKSHTHSGRCVLGVERTKSVFYSALSKYTEYKARPAFHMQTDEKATGLEAGFSRDSLISACSYVLRWVVCDSIWIKPVSGGGSPADKKKAKKEGFLGSFKSSHL